jgi:hypothetical protein
MAKGCNNTFTHARRLTEETKNGQTCWKTCAVPENIQFSFSCSFFYMVKLHSLTVSVWVPHLFLSKFLFLSFSHGS